MALASASAKPAAAWIKAVAIALAVGGCTSSTDSALSRVHAAEQSYDQAEGEADRLIDELRLLREVCATYPSESCPLALVRKQATASTALDRLEDAMNALQRAERDLDYAVEAADRRAARGAAMMGAGAAILGGQSRNPVTCTTSDTTNPTTTCW